jgi:hypothetical protein
VIAMSLTIRPTGFLRDSDAKDYIVHEDGTEVGRIYEDRRAHLASNRWFWAHNLIGLPHTKSYGRAATFEDAKAQFLASLEAFKAASKSKDRKPD